MNAKFRKKQRKNRYCTVVPFWLERVNQRLGINLEVHIQNLRYALMHVQKIPGGLNINIFVKAGMKLPFTFKNQRQKI